VARRKPLTDDDAWGLVSRGESETDLDITPMIDVTFLLLIFFMVTSTMQAKRELDVPPAKHGVGVETNSATIIEVKRGEPPIIEIDGRESTLDDVRKKVEEGIAQDMTQVIIKADREVPHGFVQEVTKVVVEFEGITFSIAVKDKQ